MALEIKKLGISLNDNSLRKLIKNDKTFYKDKKFSRTEYEKFLIKSGMTAPQFEDNIVEQEKRRQFLSSLSGGIVVPESLVNQYYKKENQTKTIKYIDLEKFHAKNKPSEDDKKDLYERNKDVFFVEFKSIRYAEINPEKISGNNNYDEIFFKRLDEIENNVLDGQTFDETVKNNNLESISIKKINAKKEDENKNKVKISDELFKKFFNLKSINSPEVMNLSNKYYLVELSK